MTWFPPSFESASITQSTAGDKRTIRILIKGINQLKREAQKAPTTKPCPFYHTTIDLAATRCPNCTSALQP